MNYEVSIRQDVVIKKATEGDAGQLHELLIESTCGETKIAKSQLRAELSGEHATKELSKYPDPVIELDISLAKPNCPVCQAFVALLDNRPIGYLLFHYYYTPWHGRYAHIDYIYVRPAGRGNGTAMSLVKTLATLAERQDLAGLMFSSTRMGKKLVDKVMSHKHYIVRNEQTDWSVYRVEFSKSQD